MKAIKIIGLGLVFFVLSCVANAQSIQVTINNFNSSHTYYLVIKVYDYTATPTNVWTSAPIQLTSAVTSNIPIYQVSKDVAADIYQIKIGVEDMNTQVTRTDQTGLLNSDDYYVGNIPLSVSL
jgi:hypothetical protein